MLCARSDGLVLHSQSTQAFFMRDAIGKRSDPGNRIAVLIAEDAPIIRSALRIMLEDFVELSVIGDSSVADVITRARKLRPRVVLINVVDPTIRHSEMTKSLRELPNGPEIVLMSQFKHPEVIRTFYAAGGGACIVTEVGSSALLAAIRRVATGRKYIDPNISDEAVVAMVGESGLPRAVLSRREREVLRFLASGKTYKEAAQELGISVASVETYRTRIVEKLDLRSRAELIRYALLSGILRAGDESDAA
ncbi:MAG: LuxR C-terminal-related transcriptional regulator [Terriglobales bacterium]